MGTYYNTKESIQEYIELAKDVNGKQLIQKLRQYLPLGSSLLEIGSGPGTDWKILNQSYKLIGSDNSMEFLSHLIAENSDGTFLELDAVTLKTDKKVDGIYSNKVLHHLKDDELVDAIKRQFEILNQNGIICHSFWKGEGNEIFKGLYVNYHMKLDLIEIFSDYFEILFIKYYKEFEKNDSILFIGRKK